MLTLIKKNGVNCVAEILPIRRKTLYIINFLKEVCYSHGFGAYIVIKWYYTCNHTVHQQTVSLLVEGLFYSPKKDNSDSVADAYISNTRFGLCIFCGTFERSYQIINVLIIWLKYLILCMFRIFLIWCDLGCCLTQLNWYMVACY